MSTLYFLEARRDQEWCGKRDVDPWTPWYDRTFSFVVRADSEEEARRIAQENAGGELYDANYDETVMAWIDPTYSTCEVLSHEGKHGVIIENNHSA